MIRCSVLVLVFAVLFPACSGSTPNDSPLAAFETYRKAMRAGDLDALKACLTEEPAKELEHAEAAIVIAMMQAMVPAEERVEGVEETGDTATIRLSRDDEGTPARGAVTLVRVDGKWKVEKESWHYGDGAGGPTASAEPAPPRPAPEGDWRFDLEGRKIPGRPAAGRLGGRPFAVRSVTLANNILTLSDGEGMDETGQLIVFLFLSEGEPLAGRTIEIGPEKDFGADVNAHVHLWDQKAPNGGRSDAQTSGFALRLVFGELADGELPGRIWLAYPDDEKTYVVGAFVATVEE